MLEHWYFCASLGLPPQTAALHLDVLAALREPVGTPRAGEIVGAALEGLGRTGTATALHALPLVLAAHHRFAGTDEVIARAADVYRDIAAVAPEHLRTRLGAALRSAAGPVRPALAALGELLDGLDDGTAETDAADVPYQDLVEQLAPTAALVAARFLVGRDARAAGEVLDEHQLLTGEALAGRYGRMALLQAAEAVAALRPEHADRVRAALATASRGAFDLEPDLLAAAARLTYRVPADPGPGPDPLDAVEAEAFAGERLTGWLRAWTADGLIPNAAGCEAREAAYRRLGGTGAASRSAMPAVLWQTALWSAAAEGAPERVARRLARWWRPPASQGPVGGPGEGGPLARFPLTLPYDSYEVVQQYTHRLLSLRHPVGQIPNPRFTAGPAGDTDPETAAWLWSPWLVQDQPKAAGATGAVAAVRLQDGQPEQLVRLLGAGLLAVRLLTCHGPGGEAEPDSEPDGPEGGDDHLLLLLIHLRDTLYRTFDALMETVHGSVHQAQLQVGHLCALLLHGAASADWVGKGLRAAVHPVEIVRVVAALPTAPTAPQVLPDGAARKVVLHWAQEASAGGTGDHRTEAGARWFGGWPSPADTLLDLIRERDQPVPAGTASRAARLYRDLHPHSRHDVFRWDWTPQGLRRPGGRPLRLLRPGDLVLSGPTDPDRDSFSVEEWQRMAEEVSGFLAATDKHGITPVTVRTLRLAALIGRPDLGDGNLYEEWVSSWSGLVSSLGMPAHLPRYVRARMFDMFRAPTEGTGSQERLLNVLEHVVDAIVGLSGGAQFYYDRLFEELTHSGLPPEAANRLRLRALRVLYHKWGGRPPVAANGNPWWDHLGRISGRGTEAALVGFLRATAARELGGRGITLAEAMASLWDSTQRPARYPAIRRAADLPGEDRRFLAATVQDRRTGEVIEYRRDENASIGAVRDSRRQVFDLFRGGALPEPDNCVLGVVVRPPLRDASTLQVNCGLDTLQLCQPEPQESRRWEIGDTVAVRLAPPGGQPLPTVVPLVPLPQRDGDVRTAELVRTAAHPGLGLRVEGCPGELYPGGTGEADTAARRRWDPDLSRAFDPDGTAIRPSVPVRWHAELNRWVPLDAGLPELAVAAGTGEGPVPVRLVLVGDATERTGYGTAWRFVTTPGHSYVLGPAAWRPADWRRLEEEYPDAPTGLIVHAEFTPGEAVLRLSARAPFDRRNLEWLAVFDPSAGARDLPGDGDPSEDGARSAERYAQEDAFLRPGADGRPQWQIDVRAVEGFPRLVRAEFAGPTPRGKYAVCSVEAWDDSAARRAVVKVQPLDEEGILEQKPTPEQYAWYARVPDRTVVDLVWAARKGDSAANLAATADGLRGRVATESLTLSGDFPVLSRTAPRRAQVSSDYLLRPLQDRLRAPLTALQPEQLAEQCLPPRDPAELDRPGLCGLVVARYKDGHQVSHVRAWFDLGGQIAVARLPVGCLDVDAPAVGDHLRGVLTASGWTFETSSRMLHFEALWERVAEPGAGWKAVGTTTGLDGTPLTVRQDDSGRPRLATEPGTGTPPVGAGRATARRGGRARKDGTFPVVVQHGGVHRVGHTTGIDLGNDFRAVHVEREQVDLRDVAPAPADAAGTRYVRVRREYDLSPVGPARRPPGPAPRPAYDRAAAWQRIVDLPDPVLTGRIDGDGRMALSACEAPDAEGVYRPWLEILDEPRAWVGGRSHPTDLVRARPVPHPDGTGYAASFLSAAPLSVPDFMAVIAPYAAADGSRCDFRDPRHTRGKPYYVGIEETHTGPAARFEFGYGWFVDIPTETLLVGGEPLDPDGLALFHGDRVEAMAFRAAEDAPGIITVLIELADIATGVERQIHYEATNANVVHLLDATVDRDRGRVTVHQALTRTRGLGRDTDPDTHAVEQPVSARIDERDLPALLAAQGEGTGRRLLLGRLVPEQLGRHRRALRFATVAPHATTDGSRGLGRDDRLYLEAGSIQETRNDYLLRFVLPEGVVQDGEPLSAVVPRREFSHRESCLRRAAKTEGLDAYRGRARMLVRLGAPGQYPNQWHGSTKSPPARSTETLRGHLRRKPGGSFGVVDADGRRIELRPGVLFELAGLHASAEITAGSVVRLVLDADGRVHVRQAIPADLTYLDERPRPAVVFPKDSLRTAEDVREADAPGRFTVAGLPGLNATARRETGAALLHREHPKIAGVVRRTAGRSAQLVPLEEPRAGVLEFDAKDPAEGVSARPVGTADPGPAARTVPWAQISFLDASAREIARACEQEGWRYHDTRTRTWSLTGEQPRFRDLPALARIVEEPVFFSKKGTDWTLRHESAALRQYGFPATELLEETFQSRPEGLRTYWAVARAEYGGVWLEMSPGRIAEIRGELVRFSDGHSLADLDWSRFAPGDLLYGRIEGGINECGHLVLTDWRPGLRGALRAGYQHRVLLPVGHADEAAGALYLGAGEAAFPYPAERALIERCPLGSTVWLDETNALAPAAPDSVRAGDTVLLTADPAGGALRVAGLPNAAVELAPTSKEHWFMARWLRDDLAAGTTGTGSVLLRQLGALPVTVDAVTDGPEPVVTVSRRRQPGGVWPDGTVLARPVAHLGNGWIVMRSGAALIRTDIDELLPGLPQEAREPAAAALATDRRLLRLHWDRTTRTLRSGLPTGDTALGETTVQALFAVNGPDGACLGVLCKEERTQALCWLPARDAAWAQDVPCDLLVEQLRAVRKLTVLRRERHLVSLVDHPLAVHEFGNLTVGQLLRVSVVDEAVADGAGGGTRLVAVAPLGLLARLSPGRTACGTGEELMTEVARFGQVSGQRTVHLVAPGARRTVLDLPEWMCGRLGRLALHSFADTAKRVDGLIPKQFVMYRKAYRMGLDGGPAPTHKSVEQQALWLLGRLEPAFDQEEPSEEERERARHTAATAVAEWIDSDTGRALVLQTDEGIDLGPALAVCRLGDLLPSALVGLPDGWLSFLLARIGDRAVASMHTEALVTQWLTRPDRHTRDGDWRRLRSLRIAQHMTDGQVTFVEEFGRAVTERPEGLPQSEAAGVARSLLAAVGRLPAAEHLAGDAPLLHRLARLGASLTPPHGQAVPRWQPLDEQHRVVKSVFDQLMQQGLPLPLLPASVLLPDAGTHYGEALLREAKARTA
ncbi:hypothetical protein [Kitasatospora sp. NPDC088134]|uniref:hypothetical protein n=1 Tax=Kitasatospora sp. NPDC088134 TaxID=3364071 RepID=UPI00382BEB58